MRRIAIASIVAVTGVIAFEHEANACGGCFVPTETPTVVTDHRMILTASKEQSTLYDQIRYQGDPESFAWVLPIAGTVDVGLSADLLFNALDQQTATRITPPPQNCPPPPPDCQFGAASAGNAESDPGGVNVLKKEVVGPFETVQLQASDPQALHNWLATNKFTVTPDVKPVIDVYVAEKFNFLALKLLPGKGTQDMRPVRVTTKGAAVVLPLRMVAAGTGANVGISLWVVGEGRYEPTNFPTFYISNDEIAWDWTQNKSNYVDVRAQKTAASGGKAWEIESSTVLQRGSFENVIENGTPWNGRGPQPQTPEERAQQDYLPVKDEQGNVTKTAEQVRREDLDTLFQGIPEGNTRVTRMRADLAKAALATDLVLNASQDQAQLSNIRQLTKELNQPQCPIWDGCNTVGSAPRDEAASRSSNGDGVSTCASSAKKNSSAWMAAGLGFAGLAFAHAIRRRKKQ